MRIPRRTSREAYDAIHEDQLLSSVRARVYYRLYHNGPLTGAELNDLISTRTGVTPGFHKRLSELKDLGVVYEVEERECTVTGRKAIAWDVTEHLPKKNGKRYQRPTAAEITKALPTFEHWERCATLRGETNNNAVERVITWLRRKAN